MQNRQVSGFVIDSNTGEYLIGASVYVEEQALGTVTNNYGFYSLLVPSDSTVELTFSYIGYKYKSYSIRLDKDTTLNVSLVPDLTMLDEIEVSDRRSLSAHESTLMGQLEIPTKQLQKIPALLGEADVLKALQFLPGVQSGSEGTAGLYVRGGGPDQNLILLDGVPVYNTDHLFGFFGVFNSDAIKHISLIKGGFPARYGGRIGSVVDINMKEGNTKRLTGQANIGLISSSLLVEGPIIKDRTSFMFAGRRTYLDLLMRPFLPKNERTGYFFYDYNAKVNSKLSEKDQVYISNYAGRDHFFNRAQEQFGSNDIKKNELIQWGNQTATIRWTRILSPRLFLKSLVGYTRYQVNLTNGEEARDSDNNQELQRFERAAYTSGIHDWSGRLDFDFLASISHSFKAGVIVTQHNFQPVKLSEEVSGAAVEPLDTTYVSSGIIRGTELGAYIEDELRIRENFKANIGIHAASFRVQESLYRSLQPRLSMRLMLNNFAVKGSYAQSVQYIHLLASSGIGLPTNLWVPATNRVKPQEGSQWAVGISRAWEGLYTASIEMFYRKMKGQISFKEGTNFFDLTGGRTDWDENIESGKGVAYGIELLVQKHIGRFTGWFGYTLSKSERQFATINGGNVFPFTYDRRHDISLVASYSLNSRLSASVNWVFASGRPIWLPVAFFQGFKHNPNGSDGAIGDAQTAVFYGARNSIRMRSYHRFDISLRFEGENRIGKRNFIVGFYNAYNRKNPTFIWSDNRDDTLRFKQVSLFPIIPSISYKQYF